MKHLSNAPNQQSIRAVKDKKPKPYEPNHFSSLERLINLLMAAFLIAYGALGLYKDDIFLPGKHSAGVHLQGGAAIFMYAAMLCGAAVLISVVIDHYDRRNNEHHYVLFKLITKFAGWVFFTVAIAIFLNP